MNVRSSCNCCLFCSPSFHNYAFLWLRKMSRTFFIFQNIFQYPCIEEDCAVSLGSAKLRQQHLVQHHYYEPQDPRLAILKPSWHDLHNIIFRTQLPTHSDFFEIWRILHIIPKWQLRWFFITVNNFGITV